MKNIFENRFALKSIFQSGRIITPTDWITMTFSDGNDLVFSDNNNLVYGA